MKKPRSSRSAPRTREPAPPPARVLLFPILVQLPLARACRPAGAEAAEGGGRFQLVLESGLDNGGPADAPASRVGSRR